MKELSIEEKAKVYDEALIIAKQWYNDSDTTKKEKYLLKGMFSELVESEDERIRKEIIDFLGLPHPQFVGKRDHEKWIAWLEKQGEKERLADLAILFPALTDFEKQVSHIFVSILNGDYEYDVASIKEIAKIIEKQGVTSPILSNSSNIGKDEQNPANKIEPKFKVGDRVIGVISNMPYFITEVCDDYYNTESGCIIMFCAQDNFELYEQKSAWSEEDEEIKKKVMHSLSLDGRISNTELTDIYNWLKSLKDRYTWKPSEEQMEALNGINVTGGVSYAGQAQELRDLYNDLKKLREE